MMVMITANTPSLNASIRPLVMLPPPSLALPVAHSSTSAGGPPGAPSFAPLFHAKGGGLDAASLLNSCDNHCFRSGHRRHESRSVTDVLIRPVTHVVR